MKISPKDIEQFDYYDGKVLNGKQTAEILGVSPPTLSEAVKYGYQCKGHPVEEWVIFSDSGRIKGFYVPEFLFNGEHEVRENPQEDPEESNKGNEEQASEDASSQVTHNNYSLLPEGEDYFRPVGATAISSVIQKALESNTIQGKVVIVSGVTLLSAIVGNAITGDGKGALVGSGAGLVSVLSAYYLDRPENEQPTFLKQRNNQQTATKKEKPYKELPEIKLTDL